MLVTGGSRGIGYAIAERFLGEGAEVLLAARGEEGLTSAQSNLAAAYGAQSVWSQAVDCSDPNALAELANAVRDRWSRLDVVVANVGDGRSISDPIPDEDQWNRVWERNFTVALNTARAFLPVLEESRGSLLFVSSIAGLEAFGAPVDYSTAKSAVVAFAKNLARKVGGVCRVNVVAPGNVYFPGGSWDEKIRNDRSRVEQIISSTVPMKRFGQPEEIADAAVFLSSERASFITGATLVVDGGQTVRVA